MHNSINQNQKGGHDQQDSENNLNQLPSTGREVSMGPGLHPTVGGGSQIGLALLNEPHDIDINSSFFFLSKEGRDRILIFHGLCA